MSSAPKKSMDSSDLADIGLIGLAVMGENLVLNMESKGFRVAVFNRTVSKVDDFLAGRAAGKNIVGAHDIEDLISSLSSPRKVMLMVKAGDVVDKFIELLSPHLSPGDVIIDGGNSNFKDTGRRVASLKEKKIHYIGAGISGGEEGALLGPSIMPGGSEEAWPIIQPIFKAICAKTADGSDCCSWVGKDGSGNMVKTVHNGIEYGDMELICEAYAVMKQIAGFTNEQIHQTFSHWKSSELDSFLIDITADIFAYKQDDGTHLIDCILDSAGQKGTGKWTAMEALDLGIPLTLVSEAVFARCVSALVSERQAASTVFTNDNSGVVITDKPVDAVLIDDLKDALLASKIVSYAQGFMMLAAASKEYDWNLNYGDIALMWRGGCIIRSVFLGNIKDAFDADPSLSNLITDSYFAKLLSRCAPGWRRTVSRCALQGVPAPCFATALSFFDSYRSQHLSTNLIQAQRDYFGAHTYERVDQPRGVFTHTNWTGHGGNTSSSTYNA